MNANRKANIETINPLLTQQESLSLRSKASEASPKKTIQAQSIIQTTQTLSVTIEGKLLHLASHLFIRIITVMALIRSILLKKQSKGQSGIFQDLNKLKARPNSQSQTNFHRSLLRTLMNRRSKRI